jgi:uncharacterized protein YlaI
VSGRRGSSGDGTAVRTGLLNQNIGTISSQHNVALGGCFVAASFVEPSRTYVPGACHIAAASLARGFGVRDEPGVTVQCLHCGHVGVLSRQTLGRLSLANKPIATFVKRLRCRKCGRKSVLATREPVSLSSQKAS